MALKNNRITNIGSPFMLSDGSDTRAQLSKFVHSVELERPFQAMFYLLNAFMSAEDEKILVLEESLLDACDRFGECMNLQLQQLHLEQTQVEGVTFMEGYQYRMLVEEFAEVVEEANRFEDERSSLIFNHLLDIQETFQEHGLALYMMDEAIGQLNEAVKKHSLIVSDMAEGLVYSDFYEAKEELVHDLYIYHDMLETIWLNLNHLLHMISYEANREEEIATIQWRFERLLGYDLHPLFRRECWD